MTQKTVDELSRAANFAILVLADVVEELGDDELGEFRAGLEPGLAEAAAFLRAFSDIIENGGRFDE